MKKIFKYFIAGSCLKLSIALLQADRGLEKMVKSEEIGSVNKKIEYYDTINIKKDYSLYDSCKEE